MVQLYTLSVRAASARCRSASPEYDGARVFFSSVESAHDECHSLPPTPTHFCPTDFQPAGRPALLQGMWARSSPSKDLKEEQKLMFGFLFSAEAARG